MNKLLISESPLMIIPTLAFKIGLNEAVVLQQIHYWVTSSTHMIEKRKWIFNTYKEWQKQLPFWSESTIKRTIRSLEDQGLILSENWNQTKMDKTKWYTIDYERVAALMEEPSTTQNDLSNTSDCTVEETSLNQAIPEITTENTSEKKTPVVEVINYLNEKHEILKDYLFDDIQDRLIAYVKSSIFPPKLADLIPTSIQTMSVPGAEDTMKMMVKPKPKPASESVVQMESAKMRAILGIDRREKDARS